MRGNFKEGQELLERTLLIGERGLGLQRGGLDSWGGSTPI